MNTEKEGRRPRVGSARPRIGYRDDNGANTNERKPAYSTSASFQREPRTTTGNNHERRSNFRNRDQQLPFNDNNQRSPYGRRQQGESGRSDQPYNRDRDDYGRQRPAYENRYEGAPRHLGQGGYGQQRPAYPNRPQQGERPYGNRSHENYQQDNYNRPQAGPKRPFRPRTEDYNPHAKYSLQKQLKYKEDVKDPNEPIRLNKYLANSGVCSRREADEFIQAGVVTVNGEVVTELGRKVLRSDKVMFHNEPVSLESKVYVLLNKPKNCVTTSDDPQGRLTVMDLVRNACSERIYPIGRLDRNTTGVLLLTNDGELASKLAHPKYNKKKIYQVWLDRDVALEDMQKIADGIELEDGEIHADAISYVSEEDKSQIGIEIHSGRNRIVRRIFEKLGYRVVKLDRVYFAGLTKKNLPRGRWRYLDEKEVSILRQGAYE